MPKGTEVLDEILPVIIFEAGRDNVVGIATLYMLDGPGIESR